jgi:acylphosphatase
MHRVHLTVHGRVQGVGFRYFVVAQARRLRLTGWVRNLPNGAVEVLAEGARSALDSLIESIRRGPPGADVGRVHERWSEGAAEHSDFGITG